MIADHDRYDVRLAASDADLSAATRLRYDVFVEELGGTGPMVDHDAREERDAFDPHCDHLLLFDGEDVVGVYRLMPQTRADAAGGFYSASEYDLAPLLRLERPLLEVGRSCLHRDHRGGLALHRLWSGLAAYVARSGAEVLFGVASFHGTDPAAHAPSLSYLHDNFLAPPDLRVSASGAGASDMRLLPREKVDRAAAMRGVPALIKSYLRLGGHVGDGAFIDRSFNTTDICLILDTARMSESAKARFLRGAK